MSNDSSAGKLVVGQWTFFAVTYDASHAKDNVCWYFSAPAATPDFNSTSVLNSLKLDRKTTYNVGAVGSDLRELALGNFNRSMHSYGLDRQFRGTLQHLQIFGSRIGGRGALTGQQIQAYATGNR